MMNKEAHDAILDPARLAALRETDLLDTPAEGAFDRLTRLASRVLHAPVALMSLIDRDRQFCKSFVGLPEPTASAREMPLSYSICQHVVASGEPLVVGDTTKHPATRTNLAVTELGARAYVGIPLVTSGGHVLGSFCVIDLRTREWTTDEIGVLHDLAGLAVTEIELRAATREAERANQAKSQFLANMSHEIRTPINAIVGYADLLELGIAGALAEGQRSYVAKIKLSSEHLIGLVNEILDLSKIEAGGLAVGRVPASVHTVVQAAQMMIVPQAAAKGVEIIEDASRGWNAVYLGDEDRVRQILVNLLSNAFKFTDRGGRISIRCRILEETLPELGLEGNEPWVAIDVEDTGIGIAPEQLDRVFEPFMQVDDKYTRERGGTGLGLTISRKFARLMGGDLTVRSRLGEGSCFTLWLPASPGQVPGPGNVGRTDADVGAALAILHRLLRRAEGISPRHFAGEPVIASGRT